jgi:peptide-methionine (S)-S-oxide reductase
VLFTNRSLKVNLTWADSPPTSLGGEVMPQEQATLGGGCFWCLEAVFEQLRGVEKVESGYAGGSMPNPTYKTVCGGDTGHAEVVRITFDPTVISYRELLDVFFAIHDPTTPNRQGNDVGTQYRSVVFTHSPEQRTTADAVVSELTAANAFADPIVTQVLPAPEFYGAEEYHQGYYRANPAQGYCQAVVGPKVAKARKAFADKLRTT